MPKKNLLENLSVSEISLVHKDARPANQFADVLLTKVFKPGVEAAGEVGKLVEKLIQKLGFNKEEILKEDEMTLEELKKMFDDAVKKLAGVESSQKLSETVSKISIDISKATKLDELKKIEKEVAKLDSEDARVAVLKELVEEAISKASNSGKAEHFKQTQLPKEQHDAFDNLAPEQQDEYMKAHQKMKSDAESGAEPDESDADDASEGDDEVGKILKAVFVKTTRSRVSKTEIEKVELVKKLDAVNKRVAELEEEKAIEKLANGPELKDLKGIAKVEDIAKAYRAVVKAAPEEAKELLELIKTLSVQVKTAGLFSEIGKLGESSDAITRLDSLAKKLAKEEGISYEKAIEKTVKDNPDLYDKSEKEKAARNRLS